MDNEERNLHRDAQQHPQARCIHRPLRKYIGFYLSDGQDGQKNKKNQCEINQRHPSYSPQAMMEFFRITVTPPAVSCDVRPIKEILYTAERINSPTNRDTRSFNIAN